MKKPIFKNKKAEEKPKAQAKPKARPDAAKAKHEVEAKPEVKARRVKKQAAPKPERLIGLHSLTAPRGAHKKRKYLGRGSSSGHGKTSTRGSKGQTSRAGRHFYLGFEGGQSPLIRRMPKRGFHSINQKIYQIVNLRDLVRIKESNITPEVLQAKGLVKDKNKLIKILGEGEIKTAVNISAHAFSKKAASSIQGAGGKVEIVKANV